MSHPERYIALFDILGFSGLVEAHLLDDVLSVFGEFRQTAHSSRTFHR